MSTKETCLVYIERIREIASGMEPAYLARTRINRLVLSCIQVIASTCGLQTPNLPRRYEVPSNAPLEIKELTQCCNKIFEISRIISQPSEALDDRWKQGWNCLLSDLDQLERLLKGSLAMRNLAH